MYSNSQMRLYHKVALSRLSLCISECDKLSSYWPACCKIGIKGEVNSDTLFGLVMCCDNVAVVTRSLSYEVFCKKKGYSISVKTSTSWDQTELLSSWTNSKLMEFRDWDDPAEYIHVWKQTKKSLEAHMKPDHADLPVHRLVAGKLCLLWLYNVSMSCRQIFWVGTDKAWLCKINLKKEHSKFLDWFGSSGE
jgi:hypothetical protein